MSRTILIPQLVIDKVTLRYADSPELLSTLYRTLDSYIEQYKEQHIRIDPVTEDFVLGTLSMISGDLKFENGQHKEAILDLNRGTEFFQKGSSILSKGDYQYPSNVKVEFERRALYCQARVTHAEALITLKKGFSDQERVMVKNILELAAQAYNDEIQLNQENDDFYHMLIALRNLFKVHIRIIEQESELADTITKKRHALYMALTYARKAIFLGEKRIPQSFFDRINKKIKDLTIAKFLERADLHWQQGLNYSAQKDFVNASILFWSGVRIYTHIQKLERRQEFTLQGLVFQVTALENDAKKELALDKNINASEKFQQASLLMQKLITTVKELGNVDLVQLFEIQSQYFDGMNLFCSGLIFYDKEEYEEALRSLKGAQRTLKVVLANSRELDNKPLTQSCKDGLKQIETYTETLSILVE